MREGPITVKVIQKKKKKKELGMGGNLDKKTFYMGIKTMVILALSSTSV